MNKLLRRTIISSDKRVRNGTRARVIFLLLFLIAFSGVNSQTNFFQKAVGGAQNDEGRQVQQTSDGGFIMFGSTKSFGAGGYDVYMIKTTVNGNVQWSKLFGGGSDDEAFSGQQTADGGYIITGYTKSFGNAEELILIKTDVSGNITWQKRYGSTSDERGYSVRQTSDLGYIVAGFTKSAFSAGAEDIFLVKTDAAGNLQWSNAYGGANSEFAYGVQQTSTGMYIVTGSTKSYGAGQEECFMLKASSSGVLQFFKTFGGAFVDYGYSIIQMSNGKYMIAGSTRSFGAGSDDAWVIQTDTAGLLQFTRTYGGASNDYAHSVEETAAGQFIISGSTRSFGAGAEDGYMIKTNSTGGLIWSRAYGGTNDDFLKSVYQMSNGQYVTIGYTNSFGVGITDFYLLRTDTAGNTGCNQANPVTVANTPASTNGNFGPSTAAGGTVTSVVVTVNSNLDITTFLCQCIAPPNITGNNNICAAGTTTLTASGGTTYTWNTGPTTNSIVVSPTVTTGYTVTVSNGSCSDTASFKVSVYPLPVINISPPGAKTSCGA